MPVTQHLESRTEVSTGLQDYFSKVKEMKRFSIEWGGGSGGKTLALQAQGPQVKSVPV